MLAQKWRWWPLRSNHQKNVKENIDDHRYLSLNTLLWMMLTVSVLVFFHPVSMPIWVYGLASLCLFWRVFNIFEIVALPRIWVRRFIVFSVCLLIAFEFKWQFSLNSAIVLFICAFSLKLLELRYVRDGYFFSFLAAFLTCARFMFDASIPSAIIGGTALWLSLTILISLNQFRAPWKDLSPLLKTGKMLLQSVPLMVILFIFFPRLPPLWTMNIGDRSFSTGLSESMSPGDISHLAQSDKVAFRASLISGDPLPSSQLYWRALTLSLFDGKTWLPEVSLNNGKGRISQGINVGLEAAGKEIKYSVLVEPTAKSILYALEYPGRASGVGLTTKLQLVSDEPIFKRFQYEVVSYPDSVWQDQLSEHEKAFYTSLPQTGNEDSQRLARAIYQNTGSQERFIHAVLVYFREKEFSYTLRPPKIEGQQIDQFLFDTKSGFCAHYASAFTFLLRSVGIPSRVVLGYQGGEYNESGQYYTVRQLDAHAWVEAWSPESGWRRFDPTAAVSPQRIELGSYNVLSQDENFLADSPYSALQLKEMAWLNQIRLQVEYVNFIWNSWVVNYNTKQQFRFFEKWFGEKYRWLSILVLAILASIVITVLSWFVLRQSKLQRYSQLETDYMEVCAQLVKKGFPARRIGDGPMSYYESVCNRMAPDLQSSFMKFSQCFIQHHYQSQVEVKTTKIHQDKDLKMFKQLKKDLIKLIKKSTPAAVAEASLSSHI